MSGNRILLTYRRKRLSNKLHGNETHSLPTDGTNDHPHTKLLKHDERSEKHSSEFLRIKSEDSLICIKCNDRDSLICCDDCSQSYHLQCLDPSDQATHQGKSLCPICVRQQDSLVCHLGKDSGKSVTRVDIEISDPRQLTVNPGNLSSPGENACKSDTGVSTEMCSESMSKSIKVDSCENGDTACVCGVGVSDQRLIHTLTGLNTEGNFVLSSSKTSEHESRITCDDSSSVLETSELKDKYLPSKSNIEKSPGASVEAKRSSTLITFSRRHKRTKGVNVSLGSSTSKLNERTYQEGCSVEVISDSKVSVDTSNTNGRHVVCQNLDDAKEMSPVEACGESAPEAKISLSGNQNASKSVSSTARPETVHSCLTATENSESEAYKDDSSFVSSADDKATGSNFLKATHFPTHLPADNNGTKNKDIGLDLNFPVHTTGLPGSSSSGLLQPSIGIVKDSQSVPCTEDSVVKYTSSEGVTSFRDHKDSLLSMAITSKKSCLQLFSDDNAESAFSPAKAVTADCMFSQERETLQLSVGIDQGRQSSTRLPSLGLSLSTGSENASYDLPNCSNISSMSSTQSREFFHDAMLLPSVNQTSSLRHKLMLDTIMNRARGLNARGSFQENPRLCTAVWTEEELDCLWVGVRRHGRGNWIAILRDSKLQFAPWRVPSELGEKWKEEQSKLFGGTQLSQHSHPKGQLFITNYNNSFLPANTRPRKETLMDKTLPSVGDGYADPISHVFIKPCLNPGNYQNETAQLQGPQGYQMRTFHSGGPAERLYKESFKGSENRFQSQDRPSPVKYPLPNLAESDRLPHWLREVVSTPPPTMETSLAPKILTVAQSVTPQVGHSHSDLYPSNTAPNFNSSAGITHKSAGLGRHSSHVSKPKNRTGDDVIIIESDASSEETISDNNCNRQ